MIVLSEVRDSGGLGKGPYSPELLGASVAVKPVDTTEPSVRKRTKTNDVEDTRVKGLVSSEPTGGKLQNKFGVAALGAQR